MDDSLTSQNLDLKQRQLKSENKILRISFVGSTLFLLSECLAAFFTHSQAVLMDCVYDLVDLAMLGPFMILVPKLYKPVTERWPYGFAQIESLFIIIKCGLLLFLDIQLLTDSVALILDGGHIVNAGAVAAFELFVSVSCVAMYLVLRNMNRHFSSPTVNAELYIWKLDAYSTGGVGLAFLIQLILQFTPLSFVVPYIDPAIAIFMALILAREPIMMIWDAVKSLILAAPGKDVMEQIRSKAEDILKGYDLYIDFLDVVKTGRKIWVDVYITQKDDMLSISSLKLAHDEIVARLKPEYQDVFVELIPEIEPDKLPG
ncbi:MAG TPA: cation transporter [Candidatus Copromorpha excrementipullorum]|uniref:Cation transporter n=1 Tax=Candidatus Allocopromorpha excrementipullorum TaxID=2840743 RepID=A0A9D1N5Y0_9FIRM|nr:cation transporter [Candidatus Copromorpha excrementipullorum]